VILPGSNAQAFQLSNTGDATVSPISIEANAPFAVVGNCSTIMPGQSCNLTIRFEPSAPGTANGNLQVSSPVGSLSISLAGAAAAGESVAAVTGGNPVAFGSVVQNTASVDREVTLRNTGNVPMSITGVSGLPLGVSVQANNCSDVAPGQSCSLTLRLVTSSPTLFASATATTLGATSNASLSLTGQVEAAQSIAQVVSGNPVAFGSVAQNAAAVDREVVLRNTGNSPLSLSGFVSLPSGVTVQTNSCANVAPSGTCSVTFRLATSAVTSFTNVTVASEGATSNADLSMTGSVQPAGFSAAQFGFKGFCDGSGSSGCWTEEWYGTTLMLQNNTGQQVTISSVQVCDATLPSNYTTYQRVAVFAPSGGYTPVDGVKRTAQFCSNWTVNANVPNGQVIALAYSSSSAPDVFTSSYSSAYANYGVIGTAAYPGYVLYTLSNGQKLRVRSTSMSGSPVSKIME